MSKFALVSTVDTMGEAFPHHEVMICESEQAAILLAASLIVEHDKNATFVKGNWTLHDEHWDNPKDFLDAWQYELSATEYFHVMKIRDKAI